MSLGTPGVLVNSVPAIPPPVQPIRIPEQNYAKTVGRHSKASPFAKKYCRLYSKPKNLESSKSPRARVWLQIKDGWQVLMLPGMALLTIPTGMSEALATFPVSG